MPKLFSGGKTCTGSKEAREWVAVRQDINGKMTLVPSQALVFDLFRNIYFMGPYLRAVYLCVQLIFSSDR